MNPKTYIIIHILEGNLNNLFWHLKKKLPVIYGGHWEKNLALFVPAGGAGYSFNQLKQAITEAVQLAEVCICDLYDDGEVVFYELNERQSA